MAQRKIEVGNISDIDGEVNIAAGDIIKNVKTIHQRALTAAEEAARARKLESKLLAQGIATLVQNLSAQASEGTESDSPYKGLLPYGLNEAEIFHGRNKAKKDLLAHIRQNPLTVLHAESGAGKSSLLQAGIAAQLIANGHLTVYLRPRDADPVDFIKRMFLPELMQAPALAKASLREFLRQVCGVLGSKTTLYLLLDQFEEFFNLLDKNEREPFLESLADCLSDPSLKVRWVLALRAETLSKLAELETVGIAPFKNMYSLHRLSRAEAQEAMTEPARRHGIVFEPTLIDHILDTLTTNGEVTPTHLQLVCTALTDDLPADQTLTLTYYIDHEGDTEGILRDYLKRQLDHLPIEEQAPAWKVLRALITADRIRDLKTYDELVEELRLSGVSKEQIDLVLARLVERRLLSTRPATTEAFELAHDYLVKEIELDPKEQARKAAQELLDDETRNYKRHKTLLSAERLAVIEPYTNELRFSTDSETLLNESRKAVYQEQLVRERRRNITVGISIAVTIAMSLLAVWGLKSSEDAKRQAKVALARQLAAQAQSIHATADSAPRIAVLLAIQSMQLFPIYQATEVFQNSLLAVPVANNPHTGLVISAAFSPDRKYVISAGRDNIARVREAATGKEIFRMAHTGVGAFSLAFSPNGRYLVTGIYDFTARVWEMATGKEIAHMTYDFPVTSVAFSPDGNYVVSGSADKTVRIWHSFTGKEIARMTHELDVTSVAFSPDSKYVASGSFDLTARVWEVESGREIARMSHAGDVHSVAFSPDGKWVVSGGCQTYMLSIGCTQGAARVWKTTTGTEVSRMILGGDVTSVAFSPNGKHVLSASEHGTTLLWEATTGKEVSRMIHEGGVSSAAFSPDGNYIVSGSSDKTARIWEAATGKEIARMIHDSGVLAVAFAPDGKRALSASEEDTAVWEAPDGKEIVHMTHAAFVHSVAFSPNGKYVVSGSEDQTVRVWEISTGKEIAGMTHDGMVLSVIFSPDGRYVISTSYDRTIRVWDVLTGKEMARIPFDDFWASFAVSPDGKWIMTGGCEFPMPDVGCLNSTFLVWEAVTGKEVARVTHEGDVIGVTFSPDGRYVLSSGCDEIKVICSKGSARVWEATTGKEIARMTHNGPVRFVGLSPDGKYIVSGSDDKTMIVWEATTGKEITRVIYEDDVTSVAFSPDGNYMVARDRSTARIWTVATGKEIARLSHDSDRWISEIIFSPDGKYVLSGSADKTARVWDAATGTEIARMTHDDQVRSVAFSPDGRYVVSGGDNTVRVWIWRPVDLIAEACSRVNRNLTRAEWQQFIGDALPYQAICSNLPIEPEPTLVPSPTP